MVQDTRKRRERPVSFGTAFQSKIKFTHFLQQKYKPTRLQSLQIVTPRIVTNTQIVTTTQIVTSFLASRKCDYLGLILRFVCRRRVSLFFSLSVSFSLFTKIWQITKAVFLRRKYFRIINKNRILIQESIYLMRNPPGSFYSHIVPK